MKEKTKDKLKSWGLTFAFGLCVGLFAFGCSNMQKFNKADAYSVNQQEDSVIFTKEELNNCSYPYLTYQLSQNYTYDDTYISYNNVNFVYEDNDNQHIVYYGDIDGTGYFINFNFGNYKFDFNDGDEFTSSLTIYSPFFAENMQKSITLTASQLNNNTYEYFAEQCQENVGYLDNSSYIIYDNNVYSFNGYIDNEYLSYSSNVTEKEINFTYLLGENYHWWLYDTLEELTLPFANSITIYSTYIHDNLFSPDQYQNNFGNVLVGFINILVGGIVNLATGIASGVTAMATSLFITNTNLSVFGGIVAIFCALALSVAITTKVYTWITSLGN